MAQRNITYLSETNLITCVLQSGLAEEVLEAAKNCGAQGATKSYARGTGIRERMGLMGVAIDEQKEVIRIIVSDEQADRVFDAMYLAGKLDTPGKGIMFMTKLDRVATYIPEDVLKKIANVDQANAG
jgi:nitrogen regulatory protein P-II 1